MKTIVEMIEDRSYLDICGDGQGGHYPVWVQELEPVKCGECDGGVVERIVGERQGMGGIEPVTKLRLCENDNCDDGLLGCQGVHSVNAHRECGETPAYQAAGYDRLCLTHLRETIEGSA